MRSFGVTWLPMGSEFAPDLVGHEYGHSFGLAHSTSLPLGNGGLCTYWDIMSCGGLMHTIGYHKEILGWIPSSRIFIPPAGGSQSTIVLERSALPPAGTTHLLAHVPIPGAGGQLYSVEARKRTGYDSIIPADGIIIHRVDPSTGAEQASFVDLDGNGDTRDAGAVWLPGEQFVDSQNGITIAVNAETSSGYQVTIGTGNSPATHTLSVSSIGGGRVFGGTHLTIDCPGKCAAQYVHGSTVTLFIGVPTPGLAFTGWSGDCSGLGHCTVVMN